MSCHDRDQMVVRFSPICTYAISAYIVSLLLKLWVKISLMTISIQTTLCNTHLWLATGQWISLGTPVSSTNKTDAHDITETYSKVALNTNNPIIDQLLYFSTLQVHWWIWFWMDYACIFLGLDLWPYGTKVL